jgi:hypothetical protein
LRADIDSAVGSLEHPHFVLWNACEAGPVEGCELVPGHYYVGGVPDTFTYHVYFHATVPVTVWIMDTENYVCWTTGSCDYRWWGWEDRTELSDGIFHEAEGCADYLAVWFSNDYGTLYPNVQVTRNPATHLTGTCAQD